MSTDRDVIIGLLRSIDASLKELLSQRRAEKPKPVASDRELDGRYGDPELKFMPRDWTGPNFRGRHFSECPPALLDLVAESCDWFAEQADKKHEMTDRGRPVSDFKRADAARARGWARRLRATGQPVAAGAVTDSEWAEDDGF